MYSIVWLLLLAVLPATLACGNYEIKIVKLDSCTPNSVITIKPGFLMSMEEKGGKCLIMPNGCIIISKTQTETSLQWKVKKTKTPYNGDMDLCKEMKNNDILDNILSMFDIKNSCPLKEGEYCSNKEGFDVTPKKRMFPLFSGMYIGNITMEHDDGKTCITMELSFKKKKNIVKG